MLKNLTKHANQETKSWRKITEIENIVKKSIIKPKNHKFNYFFTLKTPRSRFDEA